MILRTLLRMESSDIDLNSEVQLALCFLGIGTTVANFQL